MMDGPPESTGPARRVIPIAAAPDGGGLYAAHQKVYPRTVRGIFARWRWAMVLATQLLFYGYAVSRLVHFAAYLTGQVHDVRAILWSIGSLIIVFMAIAVLAAGVARL